MPLVVMGAPIFATNSGSVDSLKVSLRCGCSKNARQMRCTLDTDRPEALAIERVLQCAAARGIVSNVAVTTSAIFLSPILRGAPGQGSSSRPSSRRCANRLRYVVTVTRVMPSRSVMATSLIPPAASKMISARACRLAPPHQPLEFGTLSIRRFDPNRRPSPTMVADYDWRII